MSAARPLIPISVSIVRRATCKSGVGTPLALAGGGAVPQVGEELGVGAAGLSEPLGRRLLVCPVVPIWVPSLGSLEVRPLDLRGEGGLSGAARTLSSPSQLPACALHTPAVEGALSPTVAVSTSSPPTRPRTASSLPRVCCMIGCCACCPLGSSNL